MDGLTGWGDMAWGEPLPPRFTSIRKHQYHAVQEIINAYNDGIPMVVVDAPTGSGKTLIGELVRRVRGDRGLYVCHGKDLQDQFVRDFDAPVLKGRVNYPTVRGGEGTTADQCGGRVCGLCPSKGDCPYQQAKEKAVAGNPAVLNTAYFLAEANGPGRMTGRDLVVMDECDTVETEVKRWAEFRVSQFAVRRIGMALPKKGVRWDTLVRWLMDYANTLERWADKERLAQTDPREARQTTARIQTIRRMFPNANREDWVRVYPPADRPPALVLKPVVVDHLADRYMWKWAKNWLLMSATVIGPEQMLREIGWDQPYHVVHVPMTFPVENREVMVLPVANMTQKGKEAGEWLRMVQAVNAVMEKHPDERILIHTVSYALSDYLYQRLGASDRTITYGNSADRASALGQFRQSVNGVLLASSMDRGVDLYGDECRVQVIAKLPYPYLGDPQVKERMSREGGQVWYNLQTIRSLVQMTGRAVRSSDDWAVTYLLDKQFVNNYHRYQGYLPGWWKEALVMNRRPSEVLPGLS